MLHKARVKGRCHNQHSRLRSLLQRRAPGRRHGGLREEGKREKRPMPLYKAVYCLPVINTLPLLTLQWAAGCFVPTFSKHFRYALPSKTVNISKLHCTALSKIVYCSTHLSIGPFSLRVSYSGELFILLIISRTKNTSLFKSTG